MTFTRTLDTSLAIAVALAMVILVIIKGDALYVGLWYYIVVPTAILGACAAFRPHSAILVWRCARHRHLNARAYVG